MSNNGITAKEACEIYKNSEQPDVVLNNLKSINETIKHCVKTKKPSAPISLHKDYVGPDDFKLILEDLKSRGFSVDLREHDTSYFIEIRWC